MIDSEELAEARAIAEAATEGPWRAVETMVQSARGEALADCGHEGEPEEQDFIDAEHIAKFDPKFVIGLLDEVKRMTSDRCAKNLSMMSRELSEAKAEIDRLRVLAAAHGKDIVYSGAPAYTFGIGNNGSFESVYATHQWAIAETVGPCNMWAAAQERFSDRFGQKTVLGLLNEIERLNSTEKYLREKARDEHLARIESDEEDATEYLAIEQELAEANAEIGRLRESVDMLNSEMEDKS